MTTKDSTYRSGLILIEARRSNPNGNPSAEGAPRQDAMGHGFLTSVSFRRKIRDLIEDKTGPVWKLIAEKYHLDPEKFGIFESKKTDAKSFSKEVKADRNNAFARYWDNRVFGCTSLDADSEKGDKANVSCTGPISTGDGVTCHRIQLEMVDQTRARDQADGKRTLAPGAQKRVIYGLYCLPFNIVPNLMRNTGATETDIQVFLEVAKYAYSEMPSAARPNVSIRHFYVADHGGPVSVIQSPRVVDALTPKLRDGVSIPNGPEDLVFAEAPVLKIPVTDILA